MGPFRDPMGVVGAIVVPTLQMRKLRHGWVTTEAINPVEAGKSQIGRRAVQPPAQSLLSTPEPGLTIWWSQAHL